MRANWTSAAGGLITETSFSRRSRGEVTVHAKGVRGRVLTSQRLGLRMPNLTETDWTRWSVEEFSGIGGGRWAFGLAALHVGCLIALDTSCSATAVKDARGGCDLTQCGMKCKWRLLDERLCRKKYSHHKCAPQLSVTVL
jgi:hypothetical protein